MQENLDEKLMDYAMLEGTELANGCLGLIDAYNVRHYLSEEFKAAVEKEVMEQLKYFEDNFEIKTVEKSFTRTITTLEEK